METNFLKETIDFNYFIVKDSKYNNACFYQSISDLIFNKNIILNNNNLHKIIQKLSYEWVLNNRSKEIEDLGLNVEELVKICHNISLDEYIHSYKYDADEYVNNVNNRWGSSLEQVALSEIFKIPIFIYTPQKYDNNKNKIIIGKIINSKPHKGVRLRLFTQIGLKYFNENLSPICLLWKDGKYGPHYMSLNIKDEFKLDYNGIPLKK